MKRNFHKFSDNDFDQFFGLIFTFQYKTQVDNYIIKFKIFVYTFYFLM